MASTGGNFWDFVRHYARALVRIYAKLMRANLATMRTGMVKYLPHLSNWEPGPVS